MTANEGVPHRGLNSLPLLLAVATAYALLGWIGQAVAVQQVTSVWPASGFALAAVLFLGPRALLGIFLGSFLVNAGHWPQVGWLHAAVVAAGMALGGTTSAALGAGLLRKYGGGERCTESARGVFVFLLAAVVAGPAVAATLGTGSLVLGGFADLAAAPPIARTWWLGDATGVLLVTPLVLAWRTEPAAVARRAIGEAALLACALTAVAWLALVGSYRVEYAFLPCLLWAAFRFGRRGATALSLIVAAVAVGGTVAGLGPFAVGLRSESLAQLQAFLGIVTLTVLVLSAVLAERARQTAELTAATAEAHAARDEAERAARAKSVFLATMGHELRTPLNHILGYAEMLEESLVEAGRNGEVADVRKITTAARRLLEVLADVLDLADLETGKARLTVEPFALAPVLPQALDAVRPLAEKNGDALVAEAADGAGEIRTDRQKLQRVLGHLLANACAFTRGGTVTVRTARESDAAGEWVRITVRDTGVGIAPADLGRLFQPFTQVDGSATRTHEGTGLGLVLARRYSRLLGGDVSVESAPGAGSTFTVRIPADRQDGREDAPVGA